MPSLKLKPEHIKIMTDLNFRISILIDSKDRYRPAIDIKRPFGNSGPTTNVCEIMGWHCDEESGEYAAEDIEKAEMLIIELPVALQIVMQNHTFEPIEPPCYGADMKEFLYTDSIIEDALEERYGEE